MKNVLVISALMLATVCCTPKNGSNALSDDTGSTAASPDKTMTISGYYESSDGRVRGHKFPVKIQLLPNGIVKGIFESWEEEWLLDGDTNLFYKDVSFSGTGTLKGNVLTIRVKKEDYFEPFEFKNDDGIELKLGAALFN